MLIEKAQKDLNSVTCPECSKKGKLEVVLRCDLGTKDCSLIACCSHCQTHFQVREESRSEELQLKRSVGAAPVKNKEGTCPDCGNIRMALGMNCELNSHTCFEKYAPCSHCVKEAAPKAS